MTFLKADKNLPFSDAQTIRAFQDRCLKEHLHYCATKSDFYRRIFTEQNISISDINLNSLASLPLTEKSDLEAFNDDFCAVSQNEIVDIVLSSGSTGLPTRIMYTEKDLQRLAYNEETSIRKVIHLLQTQVAR